MVSCLNIDAKQHYIRYKDIYRIELKTNGRSNCLSRRCSVIPHSDRVHVSRLTFSQIDCLQLTALPTFAIIYVAADQCCGNGNYN